MSAIARRAERVAAGSPADAVVWEEVEARTSEGTELSGSFLAFMVVATMIAGVGILTDSIVLIIGAMVVGPEFGPLAALCVALVERRLDLARRSGDRARRRVPGRDPRDVRRHIDLPLRSARRRTERTTPRRSSSPTRTGSRSSSQLLAGVAGMLSLTTAKSGALVGVLISVTTIPAAANVGVAAAYAEWREVAGAGEPARSSTSSRSSSPASPRSSSSDRATHGGASATAATWRADSNRTHEQETSPQA